MLDELYIKHNKVLLANRKCMSAIGQPLFQNKEAMRAMPQEEGSNDEGGDGCFQKRKGYVKGGCCGCKGKGKHGAIRRVAISWERP